MGKMMENFIRDRNSKEESNGNFRPKKKSEIKKQLNNGLNKAEERTSK